MGKRRNKAVLVLSLTVFLCILPFFHSHNPIKVSAITAKGMCVIEQESGRVLYVHNETQKLPMASTTKIATCITVIENCKDLEQVVAVPDQAVGVEGSSIYLQKGEKLKIIDLLYGLMLQSGNDCAVTLAYVVGGSIEGFADMMNETARKAGAENTNFVNPHGLPHEEHYTTALDLAKISSYAMDNPVFCKIVQTKRVEIPWEGRDYDRIVINKNKILSRVEGGCGIKTGFTKKAGRCLVSAVNRKGMMLICVVLNCPNMFEESERLLENGFAEFERKEVLPLAQVWEQMVVGGKRQTVALAPNRSFSYPLKKGEENRISIEIEDCKTMQAPVQRGEKNGKIRIFLDKQLIFSEDLVTIYKVDEKTIWDKIKDFVR